MNDTQVSPVPIVAVGASAGGLEALREVFQANVRNCGMAFVVIQHLDPTHESLMAQLLERYTDMKVTQAAGGEQIEADHIYVIPPAHGLAVKNQVLELTEFRDPRGMRRPIDDFFESLAEDAKSNAACVILSGTGGDGSRGLRAIKEHGGLAIVQDPSSARYDGMPVSAIGTGLVDIVARPGEIIEALRNFFDRADDIALNEDESEELDQIPQICSTLQSVVGHDFSGYKRSTLARRIARRIQVIGAADAKEYLARLRSDETECEALFRDLLINVTRFFRDAEEFDRLTQDVIDPLVRNVRNSDELRVWVAGCSSGEEAYTLAMIIADSMRRQDRSPYVQIFATDIDDKMLDIARGATYPIAALSDIPAEMQSEFVLVGPDHFTIAPRIRDMVRFSLHNVLRDPPFSKIDLVSCRNLLIYFDEELQRQVIPMLHFSLREGGKLFLGSSETVGRFDDLFSVADQRAKIYDRKPAMGRYSLVFGKSGSTPPRAISTMRQPPRPSNSVEMRALKKIAETFAPVSMLVDAEGILLDHWGPVGRYLNFPDRSDKQVEVARQSKGGLSEIVGPLLRETIKHQKPRIARDVSIQTDFGNQVADVMTEDVGSGAYLIVIREKGALQSQEYDKFEDFERGGSELQFLQDELQNTRQRLRTTVEELETTNEELKSSNEEMMSMNEELQSTNEELTTVNDELKAKVDQLTTANADMKNFVDSTELAVLVVDNKLGLRMFTEAAAGIFEIGSVNMGQPIADLLSRLRTDEYIDMARRAAFEGRVGEQRVETVGDQRRFILRALPYRQLDGTLDGATLVFTDVTESLSLEKELAEQSARLQMALNVAKIGVWEYEPSTGRTELDDTERELLGIETIEDGEFMEPILARLPNEDRDRVNSALRKAMDGQHVFDEVFRITDKDGEPRWLHGLGRKFEVGEVNKFVGVSFDVTAEHQQLAQRELMIREMNHRVKNLFAIISSLVSISARHADSIPDFATDLRERIGALGRSHALTADRAEGEAQLRDIIETVMRSQFDRQEVEVAGEAITLPNRMVTPLALIMHEWVTNSVKYGALSVPDGRLSVTWARKGDAVDLEWTERGGNGGDPGHTGFGTRLVEVTAKQLGGEISAAANDGGYDRKLSFSV
ncbi:Chemotaxis protein methyltransferase CheR [Altererythrobacter epoxidivorans]|uniref:Chemotaxis protein methyltransferase CheR n=1 Tax=Altererythrobacter epoxidivorans TaxID=361183 RepID=A0A0M4MX86_9SPHN|nr:CheR family methyltransferase [Altererythrobacter epoxidivorans]ALE17500.1 Chemotaxis protein methyltransferase CheR [Altererythrobacter epoxidivorans]